VIVALRRREISVGNRDDEQVGRGRSGALSAVKPKWVVVEVVSIVFASTLPGWSFAQDDEVVRRVAAEIADGRRSSPGEP